MWSKILRSALLLFLLTHGNRAFCQMPNTLSPSEKVYGLSRFWQEVNYNFVYLNSIDRGKWDSTYIALIDEVQQTSNDYEYYRLLKRFCATLNDGHTSIDFPQEIKSKLMVTMFGDVRLFVENIDHKAIITRINPSQKKAIPPGSEIVEVNGISTRDYMKKYVMPYISSSTSHILEDLATKNLLEGLKGDSYKLKIKRPDQSLYEVTVTHAECTETALFPTVNNQYNLLEFKWLENKTGYLALNSFQDVVIDSLFEARLPEIRTAKSLIIDLRKNDGGNGQYGFDILKYLIPDQVVYGAKSRTRQTLSTYKAWGEMVTVADTAVDPDYKIAYLNFTDDYYFDFPFNPKNAETTTPKIVVPTVVLIGHKTESAAEDFLIYANGQKHITKVGTPTAGSTGQPYYFLLPGGAQARVCTKQDTYPDGKIFVGVGIVPDVYVERTVSDYLKGKDSELEKALDLLKTQSDKGKK